MRAVLSLAILLCCAVSSAAGEARLALGLGLTEIDKIQQQGVASLEVVMPPAWKSLRPLAGLHVSEEGDAYLYAGALYEWSLGRRWRGSFGLAAGYFRYDGGYQLGGPLEFQSRVDLDRVWRSGVRSGLTYQHLSHGGVYDNNPGSERLMFTVAIPLK